MYIHAFQKKYARPHLVADLKFVPIDLYIFRGVDYRLNILLY